MLKALRDIGELIRDIRELYGFYYYVKAEKVLILEFDKDGNFIKVDLEEFSKDKRFLYMYKRAKGKNPPNLSPTLLLNRSQIDKSIGNLEKILKYYENVKGIPKLKLDKDKILNEIKNLKLSSKENILLTIKIDGKYIGKIKAFRKTLGDLISQEGKDSKGIGVCCVCLQEKEVSGDISPFKFYTIDKPGYITGGFQEKIAYKNFPLCYDCKKCIEVGYHKIEEDLKFKIGKVLDYYLIPEFILGREKIKQETLDILFNSEHRNIMLSKKEHTSLMDDEKEILDLITQEKDVITLNFLFLKDIPGTSKQEILLHVQDVYPSRLKELFDAKKKVEKFFSSENDKYSFTYGTIHEFFSKSDPSKKKEDLRKYFLEIIDKTFRGVRIEERFIIPFLLQSIRRSILNGEDYRNTIKNAFAVFLFIKLSTKEVSMEEKQVNSLEEFLDSLPSLDTSLKKGLFVLGVLTESISQIQAKERGNKPFLKKLKDLKMDQIDVMELFSEIKYKLETYQKFYGYNKTLFVMASEYLAKASTPWKLSTQEINFYFALGTGMFYKIRQFIYNNKEEVSDGEQTGSEQASTDEEQA
ncbi:TIGR02556 family CRISPR-associated protein [Hydrogenobacter hydrogenophilus]|uniref:CRISPR-associated protein, Csh1 family n=1 Tax=Hydrogenobacter hydrogenophilus TaxID=35835 RepID=A0A285P1I2_9AQUI|nr:TIGR02556 family CRISPR-associated protein [Hydrogenobacter hydrogenophilus]SNZ15592.1 CRISPR-associated protein, Csh1 family [Hydrogenobacter hydrogenophilus]